MWLAAAEAKVLGLESHEDCSRHSLGWRNDASRRSLARLDPRLYHATIQAWLDLTGFQNGHRLQNSAS